jgi:hypothetical protein
MPGLLSNEQEGQIQGIGLVIVFGGIGLLYLGAFGIVKAIEAIGLAF